MTSVRASVPSQGFLCQPADLVECVARAEQAHPGLVTKPRALPLCIPKRRTDQEPAQLGAGHPTAEIGERVLVTKRIGRYGFASEPFRFRNESFRQHRVDAPL